MTTVLHIVLKTIKHYWKSNLAVIVGIAISTMVLTGTLFVGDSVRYSLERATELRLGNTVHDFSGIDRYFRYELAKEIDSDVEGTVTPLLILNGIASADGGNLRANKIQVIGIDESFENIIPKSSDLTSPSSNEAYISKNLADRLQLKIDDSFLLKVEKASLIPKNAPFVSETENLISIRLTVKRILGDNELGRFNLKTSQTAPFNIFISLQFINDKMGFQGIANHLLFSDPNASDEDISSAILNRWKPEDMSLHVDLVNEKLNWEISSDRVFIDSTVINGIKKFESNPEMILSYMANSIQKGENETPYSFITAGPFLITEPDTDENQILINSWLADDLGALIGDSIEISYYHIGPLRKLDLVSEWFKVKDIVPIEGVYSNRDLMPDLPGLTDAGNCRDWETSIPIDLKDIRDKDEDYWNQWRGTPKAFITYKKGKELWENRFGVSTAIWLPADTYSKEIIEQNLIKYLPPSKSGFAIQNVREEGFSAANGGVDFSQLFMALSFFLLLAGIILIALLFNIHLDKRVREIGTYKAMGFSGALIQKLLVLEGLLIALPGVILGGVLAILYNKIIFIALNTVWHDIVRTTVLQESIKGTTLLFGMILGLLLSWITLWFNVRRKLKTSASNLQRELKSQVTKKRSLRFILAGWLIGLISSGLLIYEFLFGQTLSPGTFFLSGGLLMISTLLLISGKLNVSNTPLSLNSLVWKNLYRNRARSIRIIMLFALGTFVIISTGLNKKDLHVGSDNPASGTGGFLFYMETTIPILVNLNSNDVETGYDFNESLNFIQLRKSDGDDASCLNLNRVSSPRILGLPENQLSGRYSFVKGSSDLDMLNPWKSLQKKLPGGVIPAIADQTVIQWGLGKKVGDTLVYLDEYGQEMKLKLIGGLANSIFQGSVLIDDKLFLEHFPGSSGTNVFLVDGDFQKSTLIEQELLRAFRNEGLEITGAADRLASFNEVENTYLSIFMILGGLGLILGTVGLGMSLVRNILDRQQELGILRAIGYTKKSILYLITREHLILLIIGTLTGSITAFIATIPSILSAFVEASWLTALLILCFILVNGLAWILLITNNSLKKNLIVSLRNE